MIRRNNNLRKPGESKITLTRLIQCQDLRSTKDSAMFMLVAALVFGAQVAGAEPSKDQPPSAGAGAASPATPVQTDPSTKPQTIADPSTFADAKSLLDALETADANLRTLQAGILWTKVFGIMEDREDRRGMLYFRDDRKAASTDSANPTTPPAPPVIPTRKFAAVFDELIVGDRKDGTQKQYIFDGVWMAEKVPSDKKLTRTKVARKDGDPLRIGEGPIPIPIGQRSADILSRFTAVLIPATTDLAGKTEEETAELLKHVKDCYQLKLTPTPVYLKTDKCKFVEIRLWYRNEADANGTSHLLPRMARTIAKEGGGDIDIVRLIAVKTNQPLDAGRFDTSSPEGWTVTEVAEDR
jgi:hypothetical protein